MYITKIYYLLDTVSETILGSFEAKSDAMARRLLSTFDYDKAKLSREDCRVFVSMLPITRLETFDEVKSSNNAVDCSSLLVQNVFDFEEQNHG